MNTNICYFARTDFVQNFAFELVSIIPYYEGMLYGKNLFFIHWEAYKQCLPKKILLEIVFFKK